MNTDERKAVVFTFGRFQPLTKGHKKVIDLVSRLANERQAEALVFPSSSHDTKKNPLPFNEKIDFMRQVFTNVSIVCNEEIKTPFHATGYLGSQGFTDLVFVVGGDRADHFVERFSRALDYFQSFEVVSAGYRDSTANDEVGMSGSTARLAAKANNLKLFKLATGWDDTFARALMEATRKGMGLKDG